MSKKIMIITLILFLLCSNLSFVNITVSGGDEKYSSHNLIEITAWKGTTNNSTPSGAPPEYIKNPFYPEDYQQIAHCDGNVTATSSSQGGYYPYHLFKFKIKETDIKRFVIYWRGTVGEIYYHYNTQSTAPLVYPGLFANTYLFNFSTNRWEWIRHPASSPVGRGYLDSNNSVSLIVIAEKSNSNFSIGPLSLSTDYVGLEINPSKHIVINEIFADLNNSLSYGIELYNPTEKAVNISNWYLYSSTSSWEIITPWQPWQDEYWAEFHLPAVVINSGEYILICKNATHFRSYWSVPERARVFEIDLDPHYSFISIENSERKPVDDVEWFGATPFPNSADHPHSWARYRSGYDTNNFTNDFYDEPYPTPGYENHLAKGSPLNLTATLSDSKVKLTWERPLNDGNAPITTYKIYRGSSENSLEFIASVNGSVNEYLDSNVTKGEKYYYAVSAVNPVGESNLSEIVSIEIPKEKEQVPSIGFAGMIGVIAIAMYIKYRRKKEK